MRQSDSSLTSRDSSTKEPLHCIAGSFAAVKLRLHALKAAVKKTLGAAAAAAAVTREVGGYAHAGGGYSFRQRKAAGALAEPSAGHTSPSLLSQCAT